MRLKVRVPGPLLAVLALAAVTVAVSAHVPWTAGIHLAPVPWGL